MIEDLFRKIGVLQRKYEGDENKRDIPFLYNGKVHLAAAPRENHVFETEETHGLVHLDSKLLLSVANDIMQEQSYCEGLYEKILEIPKKYNVMNLMKSFSMFTKEQQEMGIPHPGVSLDESGCNTFHKLATGNNFNKRGRKVRTVFSKQRTKEHKNFILNNIVVKRILEGDAKFLKKTTKRKRLSLEPAILNSLVRELKTKYEDYYSGRSEEEIRKSVQQFINSQKMGKKKKKALEFKKIRNFNKISHWCSISYGISLK